MIHESATHDSDVFRASQPSCSPVVELIVEHETILMVLNAFDVWADKIGSQRSEDRLGLRRFLRFFVEFADGCHHVKEEQVLFAVMHRFGFAQRPGPVEALTSEHDVARGLIGQLGRFATQADAWQDPCFAQIRALVRSYAVLKRHHIDKENRILYPLAEAKLPAEAWTQIEQSFAAMEEERECAGQIAETRALVAELIAPELIAPGRSERGTSAP